MYLQNAEKPEIIGQIKTKCYYFHNFVSNNNANKRVKLIMIMRLVSSNQREPREPLYTMYIVSYNVPLTMLY
jgi:hypothetical protein